MYEKDEKLDLKKEVGITDEVYEILRREKKGQKISMAKIVCNLVIKEYGNAGFRSKKGIRAGA